jgi:hypothetical protein
MKHPEREEWVPYVFGEAAPAERRRLQQHLDECNSCRDEIAGWQRSVGRLDSWKLPATHTPRETFAPGLAWAAAAAILILVGASFGFGHVVGIKQVRTELNRTLQAEIARSATATLVASEARTKTLLEQQAAEFGKRRMEDLNAFSLALDKLETQRLTDLISLKKDLDTVAINTDAGLRHTEQELVQLTESARPTGNANPRQN